MTPSFRPYTPADKDACMALFESNCPQYFDPAEREDFAGFLNDYTQCDYFVLVVGEDIAGCGGIYVDIKTGEGKLCWGMVDQTRHKSGLGKALLEYRLKGIKANPAATHVHIDTSQHTAPFFAKYGFRETAHNKDGYGPGIDHVEMVLTWQGATE
jgi:GNAT superfamily N-acetyltransferase